MEKGYMYAMEAATRAKDMGVFGAVWIIPPICFIIIVLIILYLSMEVVKGRCKSGSLAPLHGIGKLDKRYQNPLRDYYIKTSYNSCANGGFRNDWVSLCALENVIKQGCRCLDFEVYEVDGRAVVATSDSTKVTEKGTYNSLSIDSVLKTISEKAVSNGMSTTECPNPYDPLLLHFRIKTAHIEVYNQIADAITLHLGSTLLSNEHSYENNGQNLGTEPLDTLMGKVIIMVDKIENNHIRGTKMAELTNIMGKSAFLRSLSYDEIAYTPDMDELIDYNKKNMTFGYPNLSYEAKNYDSTIIAEYGVQMFGMCFQTKDPHLEAYNQLFNTSAFMLKPERLRYQAVTVEEPEKISEDLSYGYKTYETNYYNFDL